MQARRDLGTSAMHETCPFVSTYSFDSHHKGAVIPEPAGFPVCPGRVESHFSMSMRGRVLRITTTVVRVASLLALFFASACVCAAQINIPGPAGSQTFGLMVVVLPNSNIVVADLTDSGAVYLYNSGGTLISTLTGISSNDKVGGCGIFVLPSGNFLVASPTWSNGTAASAGAVTWANGLSGVSGIISSSNSLIGTTANGHLGTVGIVALSNRPQVIIDASAVDHD